MDGGCGGDPASSCAAPSGSGGRCSPFEAHSASDPGSRRRAPRGGREIEENTGIVAVHSKASVKSDSKDFCSCSPLLLCASSMAFLGAIDPGRFERKPIVRGVGKPASHESDLSLDHPQGDPSREVSLAQRTSARLRKSTHATRKVVTPRDRPAGFNPPTWTPAYTCGDMSATADRTQK